MNKNIYRNASIFSAIVAVIIILAIYLCIATVDLVFIKDDHEIYRMKDVGVFSDVTVDPANVEGGLDLEYTYVSGDEVKDFENSTDFKIEIGKTLLINLTTFKWEPHNNVIVMNAK